ncbi:PstS family phosphate ABC transporter substrate-binding protein [Paenibacillus septentrionalis]|uniref:PstS family phosphate ABC transporter substrate-binding protein n=1 Tax=Paenibacillus septentrionalis TaxID=429342 RepID=A0ABW1V9J5_9BACL
MKKVFKTLGVPLMLVLVMVVVAACGNSSNGNAGNNQTNTGGTNTETTSTPTPENQTPELSGQVIVDGSGTVYPLMARISEEYMSEVQTKVSVQTGRAGSSAGFQKFIPGELDFANASRKIKDEEAAELEAKGLVVGEDVLEFRLAYDGLTMVINPENDWATEMTKEEIVNMYLSGHYAADDVVKWSDIRPEWPAEQINFYGPNENHGTYEFFYEVILGKQEMVKTANLQQEYSTLVDLVSKDKNAIAFFGFGYYITNTDKLTAVHVDFGNGPVEPSLDTIGEDLDYAGFTRPVYTYLYGPYAKEKPQVLDYAIYVMEVAKDFAGEAGFAPLPDSIYAEYKAQLEALK